MSRAYRPQLRWFVLGPLLGALCGSAVAFTVLLAGAIATSASPRDLVAAVGPLAVLAALFGGLVGAAVGLVAGVPLVFLVGRHLPRAVAERRALVLGALLPPVAMYALGWVVAGEPPELAPGVGSNAWLAFAWFGAPALLGGPLAARAERRLLPHDDRDRVS